MSSQLHYYFPPQAVKPQRLQCDLCIYGGNAAGVMAAIEAARHGLQVILLEPGLHLGGMTSSGLGMTDFGKRDAVGGLALEFYQRVGRHYGQEVQWRFEPHVAEAVFHQMLAEVDVRYYVGRFLDRVTMRLEDGVPRLNSLVSEDGLEVVSRMFIDASYEGDLMAKAGVTFFVGREGNAAYGESLNGQQILHKNQFEYGVDPYRVEGDPSSGYLEGIDAAGAYEAGAGDRLIQAYNFRMCLTQREDLRISFPRPVGYDASRYELLLRYLKGGWNEAFRKFDPIPNGKTDTNNHGAVSTDFIGGNYGWPEGSYSQRERIFQDHVVWQQGLQWFLANDPRVPAAIREPMSTWGLCADEFCETGGWPHQLYIREARRMVSDYVVSEADCRWERVSPFSIGRGAYNMDSHHCRRLIREGRLWNEGDVQVAVKAPYAIDYRAIIPRRGECANLLVPVCLSATHIAYGSARMEPVFMVLGQSAAAAATLALAQGCTLHDLPYPTLRERLLAVGQVL